ncbi:MAG: hypothetical protein ABSE82_17135, partial [Nitrososphaerales archaeon]
GVACDTACCFLTTWHVDYLSELTLNYGFLLYADTATCSKEFCVGESFLKSIYFFVTYSANLASISGNERHVFAMHCTSRSYWDDDHFACATCSAIQVSAISICVMPSP